MQVVAFRPTEAEKKFLDEIMTSYQLGTISDAMHKVCDIAMLKKHTDPKVPIHEAINKCAHGISFPTSTDCHICAYNKYCDYSSANKDFVSHEAT